MRLLTIISFVRKFCFPAHRSKDRGLNIYYKERDKLNNRLNSDELAERNLISCDICEGEFLEEQIYIRNFFLICEECKDKYKTKERSDN